MQMAGMSGSADRLLRAAIEFYDRPWSVSGAEGSWLVSAKAQALSLLGQGDDALADTDDEHSIADSPADAAESTDAASIPAA